MIPQIKWILLIELKNVNHIRAIYNNYSFQCIMSRKLCYNSSVKHGKLRALLTIK